ncbi:hypothetical protein BOX15_Mlig030485g1 [Macrostomum lignano]|uniref:V-SNARE coiled-coil homology domain-containing protein n=1 Tax=Macrostomum lignano TaxID=282301 RepID=A0A267DF23_9PLAT|nr:hypothetical protein BOX15_Mlig030485g1 [Macrostomum lignano]
MDANTAADPAAAPAPNPDRAAAAASGDGSRLYELREEVHVVSNIMRDNVNKVIEREGHLSDLVERSENLQDSAAAYQRTTTALRRKMWWQNTKMRIIIGVAVTVIVIIIIMAILGSAGVFDSKSN